MGIFTIAIGQGLHHEEMDWLILKYHNNVKLYKKNGKYFWQQSPGRNKQTLENREEISIIVHDKFFLDEKTSVIERKIHK